MVSLDENITLYLNGFYNSGLDTFFWYVSYRYTWFIIGALLLAYLFWKKDAKTAVILLLFIALMILCTDQFCNLIKHTVKRYRPCWNEEISDMVHIVNGDRGGKYGFFSAHAAIFFGLAYMTTQFFKNKYYTITMYTIAVLVSYSRIYLGRHFLGDILVGAIVGTAIAMLIWHFHNKFSYKYFNRSNSTKSK